jgi:dihydrofolate synthase/folylpolyglutamate synthase
MIRGVSADERLHAVAERYPRGVPRRDLSAVDELRERGGVELPRRAVAVVGTNGKTSTATYLARLLTAGGVRAGLFTSPHISEWSERVRIDDTPVETERLASEVEALDGLAARRGRVALRFFDLLTLAAARIFAEDGVDVGVFEAGIGGRLDPTAVLRPRLVVLTGVGRDHADVLGEDERTILREKLGVAPRGATVVAGPLGELERDAAAETERRDLALELVDVEAASFVERNRALARAAASACARTFALPLALDERAVTAALAEPVRGRLERGSVDGVDYVLDAAHNEQAWRALCAELDGPVVAVVSLPADRPLEAFARVVAACDYIRAAVATAASARSAPACDLADALSAEGVEADAVAEPVTAVRRGLERARAGGMSLAVFGTTYLVEHGVEALGDRQAVGAPGFEPGTSSPPDSSAR